MNVPGHSLVGPIRRLTSNSMSQIMNEKGLCSKRRNSPYIRQVVTSLPTLTCNQAYK
jgi:hypothetical protein